MRTGGLTYSSARIGSDTGPFEVNRRVVLAAREIGCGHASMEVRDSNLPLVFTIIIELRFLPCLEVFCCCRSGVLFEQQHVYESSKSMFPSIVAGALAVQM